MRKILIMLLSMFFVGCSVRFPQIDRLIYAYGPKVNPLDPILWIAQIDTSEQELIPLIAEQGNIYVNKAGVELYFDGFVVRKFVTFDENIRHLEFIDSNKDGVTERQIWVNYRLIGSMTCNPWQVDGGRSSVQQCQYQGKTMLNRRELNVKGELIRLEQPLGYSDAVLLLKKKIT